MPSLAIYNPSQYSLCSCSKGERVTYVDVEVRVVNIKSKDGLLEIHVLFEN